MKNKIYFLAILVFGLGFLSSCSSDDDNGSGLGSNQIVGKWEYLRTGELVNGIEILEPWEHECSSKKDNVEFTSANEAFDIYHYSDCSFSTDVFQYALEGDVLKMTYTDNGTTITETVTVVTLNSTTLKVKQTFEYAGTSWTSITEMQRM